ncbi:L,D-transpeptidase family protein [Massilia sp. BKSP1R2A-1]|uniref:L,D-transpeptidase family protein n=1 Tax=Massilia sp. BKSP1R2A-1 TaxID=3422595 RepID=UPI003D34E453
MNLSIVKRPGQAAARLALAFLLGLAHASGAAAPGAAPRPALVAPPTDAQALALRLYASGPAPRWLEDGQALARQGLELLADAASHGLDPALYGTQALSGRLESLRGAQADAAFGHALSVAMLQYLADLHGGRTASPYRPAALDGFDPVAQLRQALAARHLARAVDAAAPAIPLYGRVRETLARYRRLARETAAWPALPPAEGALAEGSAYAGAAALRERLRLLGDIEDAGAGDADADRYTPALAAAVRRFQSRHGLEEDGILGPATYAALAVPPAHRAAQLALTLERLRWLPPLHGRIVAVNVPAYRLWAFETGPGAPPPLEMRVIVGKAAGTPTPLFIGQMRYLEFNPYWNVPRSIATAEILPSLARDPGWLRRNDMELVMADGRVADAPGAATLAGLRAGAVRIRQRPGARNVLGAVKFAMPNPMNIYLHSTAAQELFRRSRRDLSHGCIRVEDAAALAQFVLADPLRWNAEGVTAAMRPGATRTVTLAAPVPVVLFYATAIVDRHGRALFAEDIYKRDAPLLRTLRDVNTSPGADTAARTMEAAQANLATGMQHRRFTSEGDAR